MVTKEKNATKRRSLTHGQQHAEGDTSKDRITHEDQHGIVGFYHG